MCTRQVRFETEPELRSRVAVGPEELADVTAEACFNGTRVFVMCKRLFEQAAVADADINHDGKLSFAEFHQWFTGDSAAAVRPLCHTHTPWSRELPRRGLSRTSRRRKMTSWTCAAGRSWAIGT